MVRISVRDEPIAKTLPNKKTARRRSRCSICAFDQATASDIVPLRERRYVMKPTPAKPRIIMAQVEDSGTAETAVVTVRESTPMKLERSSGSVCSIAKRAVEPAPPLRTRH